MKDAVWILMNIAVIAIITGLSYLLEWLGPEFATGMLVGGISLALYIRYKLGYWP